MNIVQELQQLKDSVREIEDRRAILDCIYRELRGRDRQDVEIGATCWWPEGFIEHSTRQTPATDHPARANKGHQTFFRMTSHNLTNHLCDLDGDTAHCESYVIGALLWKDEDKTTLAFGRYLDQMEKRNGEWRILIRRCTIEMTSHTDASWLYSDNVKGFLKGLWTKDDPSYARPFKVGEEGERW